MKNTKCSNLIKKLLVSKEVEVELEVLPEHSMVRGNFASGDDAADKEMETEILNRLNSGDDWAWFTAKVTARIFVGDELTIEATEYLGCCSYANEKDFSKTRANRPTG